MAKNHGHAAAREIERDFINFPKRLGEFAQSQLVRAVNDGAIKQVLEASLEETVEVGMFQNTAGVVAMQIEIDEPPCVSVPVLSVHSTSIAPKFWIALSCLTMVFSRAIAMAPRARLALTIIGSISGVRPTAMAMAKKNASIQFPLMRPFRKNTIGTITSMNRMSTQVYRLTPRSKLVSSCCPARLRAM